MLQRGLMGPKVRLCDGVRDPMGFHSPNLLEDGYDIRTIQELLAIQLFFKGDESHAAGCMSRLHQKKAGPLLY